MVAGGHQQRGEIIGIIYPHAIVRLDHLPLCDGNGCDGVGRIDEGVIGFRAAVVGVIGIEEQYRIGFVPRQLRPERLPMASEPFQSTAFIYVAFKAVAILLRGIAGDDLQVGDELARACYELPSNKGAAL